MIGLDTNILARYYIDDDTYIEAAKQRLLAKSLIESGKEFMICKTAAYDN